MDIVWKILGYLALVLLEFVKVATVMSIVNDIRKIREERKKEKERRDKEKNKDYPYLPFDPVTAHYGWSYESVLGKFGYIIWYHENGKPIHSVVFHSKNSRKCVEDMCRGLEGMLRFPEKGDQKLCQLKEPWSRVSSSWSGCSYTTLSSIFLEGAYDLSKM